MANTIIYLKNNIVIVIMANKINLIQSNIYIFGILFFYLNPAVSLIYFLYYGFIYEYNKKIVGIIYSLIIYNLFGFLGLIFTKITILMTLGFIYSNLKLKDNFENFNNTDEIKNISYLNKIKKNNIISNSRLVFHHQIDNLYFKLKHKYKNIDLNIVYFANKLNVINNFLIYLVNDLMDNLKIIHYCIYNSNYIPYVFISDLVYLNFSVFKLFNKIISELETKLNKQNNNVFNFKSFDLKNLDNNVSNIPLKDKELMIKDLDNMMYNMTSMFNKIQYSKKAF